MHRTWAGLFVLVGQTLATPVRTFLALSCLLIVSPRLHAIEPADVFLLVNKNTPASQAIAHHYCDQRSVPRDNIVVLDLPTGEDITRVEYNTKLLAPLRAALKEKRAKVKVLVSTYGVPLRVGRALPSDQDKADLEKLRPDLEKQQAAAKYVQQQIAAVEPDAKKDAKSEAAAKLADLRKELAVVQSKLQPLEARQKYLLHAESEAAVDSELMLLWWENYDLRKWQFNTLNWLVPENTRKSKPPVVMVSRLDGPSLELIKKLIDTSVAVEKKGLVGKVYVDARGFGYTPGKSSNSGYDAYDESLREMARLLDKEAKLPVTLDNRDELFKPGSCPDCALYCGWYSHANYVDCCTFVPGAVAYHIASSEAMSLRNSNVKYWCKNLLDKGVVATLGPVAEPYTIGFPKPAEFFGFLASGEYTLVECYSRTLILTSWMTVLVGDPLYNPYKAAPRLKSAQVQPSPAGNSK
jgi:uncharacterized protein (TIGR03790 family)